MLMKGQTPTRPTSEVPLVDLSGLHLPKAETPQSGVPWYFQACAPILGNRVIRVSLDTGAMAVSVNLRFASMVLRAQDEHFEKTGGLDPQMLVLSDLGRIEEQRFVGFAETDWNGGITVDVRATLRLYLPQAKGGPIKLPDLVTRVCPD